MSETDTANFEEAQSVHSGFEEEAPPFARFEFELFSQDSLEQDTVTGPAKDSFVGFTFKRQAPRPVASFATPELGAIGDDDDAGDDD